jgi:queuosine precursor transporter
MSELICFSVFVLMCFALIGCVYLGRTAIFVYTVGCILVSNVTVTKQVQFLGITTSLAVFIFSVTYLAHDILTEYWGKSHAMKLVMCNLAAQVAFMVYSSVAILTPSAPTDEASAAIITLFTVTPRVTMAAVLSAVGGYICVTVFSALKKRQGKGRLSLAIRNSISTILGNWVNTVVFFLVAFYGIFPDRVLSQIVLSALLVKLTLGILDTPFMFLARWAKNKNPANHTSESDWAAT